MATRTKTKKRTRTKTNGTGGARQCELCWRTSATHRIAKSSGLCNPCEASLCYWSNKTAADKMKRKRQLDSFNRRMSLTLGKG